MAGETVASDAKNVFTAVGALVLLVVTASYCSRPDPAEIEAKKVREAKAAEERRGDAERLKKSADDAAKWRFDKKRDQLLTDVRKYVAAKEWRLANQELEPHAKFVQQDTDLGPIATRVTVEVKALEKREEALAAAELRKAKKREGVSVGMSMEDVLASSWGTPQKVNRTITSRGTNEQWVYPGYQYLYFDNGKLRSIQTSR